MMEPSELESTILDQDSEPSIIPKTDQQNIHSPTVGDVHGPSTSTNLLSNARSVSTSKIKHDFALAFRKCEEELAFTIMDDMRKLKIDGKPLPIDVRLFNDEECFGGNKITRPYLVSETCRIVFIIHTDDKNCYLEDSDFDRDELISELRIIKGKDNVRSLHTKKGLRPPVGLSSMDPFEWHEVERRAKKLFGIIEHEMKKTNESLWDKIEKLQPEESRYKMTGDTRGHCYIFNNKCFKKQQRRLGTDLDRDGLRELFKDKLKFQVTVFNDNDAKTIEREVETLSKKDHSKYSCVVLVFLTHGSEGTIYGSDDESIKVEDILFHFRADRCPTLAEKPKLFFFASCRGSKYPKGVRCDGGDSDEGGSDSDDRGDKDRDAKIVAPEAHFFTGFATVRGKQALRNEETGSWYIQGLIRVLSKSTKSDFLSMMTDVKRMLHDRQCESSEGDMYKQTAVSVTTLQSKLYF